MRTLELNKTSLWAVHVIAKEPILDDDGFETGELNFIYTEPREVRLHLYPSNGDIIRRLFGYDASFDMIAVSTDVNLDVDTLLFVDYPTPDYSITYTYSIVARSKSLNVIAYGLEMRTGG